MTATARIAVMFGYIRRLVLVRSIRRARERIVEMENATYRQQEELAAIRALVPLRFEEN